MAERFEVSRRTINREIENICKAGIPLITTQGYGGGVSIADGYKIDKALLTGDELQTVMAALKGIDTVSSTSYLTKLSNKLFSKDNPTIDDDIIIIDLASHYQKPLTEKIEAMKKAIGSKQTIAFKYCSNKGETQRKIEQYRLVFRWSSWYVLGYCLDNKAYRLFKLNRLWELEVLADKFEGRAVSQEALRFDNFLTENNFHLKALFCVSEKHRLIGAYGVGCYDMDQSGGFLFEWDFASYENMREWIFSFGDRVAVIEPKSLQEDRIKQAENILKNV